MSVYVKRCEDNFSQSNRDLQKTQSKGEFANYSCYRDTVEKEKRRINNIHYNVIDEIQKQQNTKEEETFGDEEKDDNKRDYAADGLGTNDWRADFDRVLARSRAALFRAQEE